MTSEEGIEERKEIHRREKTEIEDVKEKEEERKIPRKRCFNTSEGEFAGTKNEADMTSLNVIKSCLAGEPERDSGHFWGKKSPVEIAGWLRSRGRDEGGDDDIVVFLFSEWLRSSSFLLMISVLLMSWKWEERVRRGRERRRKLDVGELKEEKDKNPEIVPPRHHLITFFFDFHLFPCLFNPVTLQFQSSGSQSLPDRGGCTSER